MPDPSPSPIRVISRRRAGAWGYAGPRSAALILTGAAVLSGCAMHRASLPAPPEALAPAPASQGALSLDTPVEKIVAAPGGREVLDRDMPGLTTHPEYSVFKGMSLKSLAAMSNGKITPAKLAQVQADLAMLPPDAAPPAQ